jgi:hypothetical protein
MEPKCYSTAHPGASYVDVTPQIGAIRCASVVVTPSQTATNELGRTTASVTNTVQ